MSSKPQKYKLRNKSHEIVGQYTEKELLTAIASGKYSGEEEVLVGSSVKWQRLASNPTFYDAFLKRVHGKEYGFETQKPEAKEDSAPKKKTNENLTEVENVEIRKEKTEVGKAKREKGTNLTLRESEIQSLFKSESHEKTEVQNEEMIIPSREEEEKSLPKIQMSFAERQQEKDENTAAGRIRDRRRIAMWALVVVLLLGTLFDLGQSKEENPAEPKEVAVKEKTAVSPLSLQPASNKIILELANIFYEQDTLPGYRLALTILESGNVTAEDSLGLVKKKCEVISELLKQEKNNEDLIKELTAAVSIGREKDPQAAEFYRAEASVQIARGNISEAKKIAQRAKEVNPGDPENTLLMAEVALLEKNASDSKVLLETLDSSLESARKKKIWASVDLALQNWKSLEISSESCVSISPAHAECFFLLSEGYAKQNQLKKARAFLDLAARLSPMTSADVSKNIFDRLSQLEAVIGKADEAKRYKSFIPLFEEKANTDSDTNKAARKDLDSFLVGDMFLVKRGEEQQKEKRTESAFKYFVSALSLDPKSREAALALGLMLEKNILGIADYRKVEAFYQWAIQQDPSFVKAYVRLGAVETEQYNFEKGHNFLTYALRLDEQDGEAYFQLGKHYFKRQDYVAASEAFLKSKQNNFQGDELYYYFGLVRQKVDRSKLREAMESFYTAYSINPENYDALSEWLKLKVQASEKAFAIKFLKSLQANDPKNPEILRVLGEVYFANSEPRRAITYYHRSLDINNRSSKTRMSLAKALESIGELDTAAEEFHEASKLDPKNAEGLYESARVLFQLQNYPKMGIVTKKLLDLSPNYPGSHKLGSLVAQSTGDKEKAIAEMKREVENNPENYSFVIEFAELYMRFNMFNEAIAELSKITNLPTENAPDKAKAAQYIKVRLTAYYLLSGCYRLLSKPELAEGAVKLGLKVDSENALLRRELCFVYSDQQRFPEATKECEYYLRRNPAAEDADRIKQKLKDMNIDYY